MGTACPESTVRSEGLRETEAGEEVTSWKVLDLSWVQRGASRGSE